MRSIFTIAALAGFAFGVRHFTIFLNQRKKDRLTEKRLEVWESEGGAVPAQVRPQKASAPSSPGVG